MIEHQNKASGLLFICGSLQPGADGIGDYTRRIAGELKKKGFKVSIIAFNDKQTDIILSETQKVDNTVVDVLRLPSKTNVNYKLELASEWIRMQNPEWISIQFVLYAFNNRGLPLFFSSEIKKLCEGRKVHIMFHELWLGVEKHPSLKDRIYGVVQKSIIKTMVSKLSPAVVHSHSSLYLKLLQYNHINARKLNIISNIPIVHQQFSPRSLMADGTLKFLVFGYISPNAPIAEFAGELRKMTLQRGVKPEFIFSGRNGGSLNEWTKVLDENAIPYSVRGVLSVEELSDLMNEVDIGISTTPFLLYEKSGSVAAMFKHGIPVINVAQTIEWDPKFIADFKADPSIVEYVPGMLVEWMNRLEKPERKSNLKDITTQFCNDLGISNSVNLTMNQ
ncbi:MAG: hypothetical protein ACKOXF_11420 [Chitinophagaceae bacterium]